MIQISNLVANLLDFWEALFDRSPYLGKSMAQIRESLEQSLVKMLIDTATQYFGSHADDQASADNLLEAFKEDLRRSEKVTSDGYYADLVIHLIDSLYVIQFKPNSAVTGDLAPDVVEATRKLHEAVESNFDKKAQVVLVSPVEPSQHIVEALESPPSASLVVDAHPNNLQQLTENIVAAWLSRKRAKDKIDLLDKLSVKEQKQIVVQLITYGYTRDDLASLSGKSRSWVDKIWADALRMMMTNSSKGELAKRLHPE